MGLFSSKKITLVSSTVYNMAGDEENRPHFLKNSVYGAIMSPWDLFIGETVVKNHLAGPGINQRKFYNWAVRTSYPGLPDFTVTRNETLDVNTIAPFIDTPVSPAGLLLQVQSASMTSGDYEHLVDDYVLENNADLYNTNYVTSYDVASNMITIQWEGGGTVDFSAGTYSPAQTYIVANYYHYLPTDLQDLITGSTTTGVLTKPSTSGYSLDDFSNTGIVDYDMTYDERIIVTYTGPGAPADTDDTTPESDSVGFNGLDETWSKITYEGNDGSSDETINREHFLEITEYRQIYTDDTQVSLVVNEDTPSAGITQTIETRRIGEHLRPIYDWRIDTQDTSEYLIINGSHVFIYQIGDGEAVLDALLDEATTSELETEYFPFLPIRMDNDSITEPKYDDITGSGLYEKTNRAYRRASGSGQSFSKLVDEIEENPDIDDIDFAFIHFGVGLNVTEPDCKKYMYNWFKNVSTYQKTNSGYMDTYKTDVATYLAEKATMDAWIYAQGDPARSGYGDDRPIPPKLNSIQSTSVRLKCADSQLANLDMRVSWVNITETLHNGLGKAGALSDEVWWQGYPAETPDTSDDFLWQVFTGVIGSNGQYEGGVKITDYEVQKLRLIWQTSANTYKKLTIWGLVHNNLVYNGESVDISGRKALGDSDPTGFIVPLHYPSLKDTGLIASTQMATANTFIVFNSYEIVKQKWYQGWIGMVIIFIAIVAISIMFPPAGGVAGGILGPSAGVGAAMGLTGTAALVAGAIANALVAIAISQIISYGAIALFGDKIGAIIAAVVSLAISMGMSGFDFSNISELMTTANILKITSAVANGYSGYTQGAVAEIGDEMEKNVDQYEAATKKIEEMLSELRGSNSLQFNPLYLTDSVKGNDSSTEGGYITETLDQFIHRTTMTGSDIVDISLSMVNNFADLSLELPSK